MPIARALVSAVSAALLPLAIAGTGTASPVSGQTISNTATLTFSVDGASRSIASNTVTLVPKGRVLPTRLSIRQPGAGYKLEGFGCTKVPTLVTTPSPVSEADLAASAPLSSAGQDETLLFVLEASGENRDPTAREKANITFETSDVRGVIVLTETAPNSGVFAGGLPSTAPGNEESCGILINKSNRVRVRYDGSDISGPSAGEVLIDPEGVVFDSRTGKPVDGATVTLIDEATGQPAQVVADDGVSTYPSTVVTGSKVQDGRGEIYNLGRGMFRFPLVAAGRYRLRIVPPSGYVAPSAASPAAIAALPTLGDPFVINDASYGGVLTVEGFEPIVTDIPLDPAMAGIRSALVLRKTVSVPVAEVGDIVQYRLDLDNAGDAATAGTAIIDDLPAGLRYRRGSTRGAAEPEVTPDGRELRFSVAPVAAGGAARITYLVEVSPAAPQGEVVNRARATAAGLASSNEASATLRIRPTLFADAMTILGRVTEGACGTPDTALKGVSGVRLLLEDGRFVVTDRDGLFHFEDVRPGTHVVQIDPYGLSPTLAPVACERDTRAAGSASSRFVEGGGGSVRRADFRLRATGAKAVAQPDQNVAVEPSDAVAAGNRSDWLAAAQPGIGWLFPEADHNPRAPAMRVVIRHLPGQRVALSLNGAPVDPLSFDGSEADAARGVAVSRWTGLPLRDRDNRLDARVLDADGRVVATLDRVVHYANVAARATFVADRSVLVADGLRRPLVAVRVTDRDGRPVRAGTPVPFRVDPPFLAQQEAQALQTRQLSGLDRAGSVARVTGDDGIALIPLQPTRQAGMARVTVTFARGANERPSEIRAWLAAPPRDWVIVGFARGTIGHDMLSHAEPLERGQRGRSIMDGQVALYAKGRVRGSWLLTAAYDSDRRRNRDRDALGTIDPDRYYTVYGDGTLQGHDAPSRGKLYLRLERREFYALYGDFETGLVDARLARYSRTVNGAKAEYAGDHLTFTAFAARDDNRYGRDEIQGNGLSGPYRLSVRDIVAGSDKLRIETRDRYRSERVLATRQLTRHLDYDIDPVAGTLRFREPILSRDAELNPVFIVVDYEKDAGTRKLAAGGRAAVRTARAEIGASLLRDDGFAAGAMLGAIDATLRLRDDTVLRGEAASGGRDGIRGGTAWLTEVEHHGSALDLLAYARQQDARFGLGQQNFGEAGTRKIGIDTRLRLTDRLSLTASGWHQQQLVDDASRIAGEARIEYRRANGTLFGGVQFASDRGLDTTADTVTTRSSRLLTIGGTQSLFADRLKIDAQAQTALGGRNDSTDFPARQRIGASWKLTDAVRLVADHEHLGGRDYTAETSRIGFDLTPWAGARLLTTLNQGGITENGARTFAQYGLSQSLPLSKRWTVDATLDSSRTVAGRIDAGDLLNRFHPPASGGVIGASGLDGDFTAATLGATYRGALWSWTGRVEFRDGMRERRWGLTSNLLRTLDGGGTLASSARAYRVTDAQGATVSSATADLSLALRRPDSRWSVLERFQLHGEQADAGAAISNPLALPVLAEAVSGTVRAVNTVAVNYRTGIDGAKGFEASVFHGVKYVRGRYAGETMDGVVDTIGVEARQDVLERFDIGVQASVRHGWTGDTLAYSAGPSVGVSPAPNMWLTMGYNISGYRDREFEADRWTRRGAYLTMRMKIAQSLFGGAR